MFLSARKKTQNDTIVKKRSGENVSMQSNEETVSQYQ